MPQQDLFGDAAAPAPESAAPLPRQPRFPASPARFNWFFALRPAAGDAASVHAFAEKLLRSQGLAGTRIGLEQLHITLEPIGQDIDTSVLDSACHAADMVRGHAFDVRFDAAMTFAIPRGPFVLLGAKGLEDGLNGVRQLRTQLGCALADDGFRPSRRYEPHMTLGYDPHKRVDRMAIETIGFKVDEFALVKSHIGHSLHEVVRTWQLRS